MPEYLTVESYLRCPDQTLSLFLEQYRRLLEALGDTDPTVATRLAQIAWEPDGSGIGISLHPARAFQHIVVNEHPLLALPGVQGWTRESRPFLQEPWLRFTLDFETQTERQNLDTVSSFDPEYGQKHTYQPGVERAIWSVMRLFASHFPQALIYFTNEAQEGRSWRALVGSQEELWAFAAALIPHAFSAHFTPIPDAFAHILLPEGVGLAHIPRWKVLPWM